MQTNKKSEHATHPRHSFSNFTIEKRDLQIAEWMFEVSHESEEDCLHPDTSELNSEWLFKPSEHEIRDEEETENSGHGSVSETSAGQESDGTFNGSFIYGLVGLVPRNGRPDHLN